MAIAALSALMVSAVLHGVTVKHLCMQADAVHRALKPAVRVIPSVLAVEPKVVELVAQYLAYGGGIVDKVGYHAHIGIGC